MNVYLKDTVLTVSIDTPEVQSKDSKKKISFNGKNVDNVKTEIEAIFQDQETITDSTFSFNSRKTTEITLVFQAIYLFVLALLFISAGPRGFSW